MFIKKTALKQNLFAFLSIVCVLITIGLIFIYSSSSVYALHKMGTSFYYLKKQLGGCLLGLASFFSVWIIPLTFLHRITPLLFLGSLTLTACTLLPKIGITIHGSSRWINLGFITGQPSELLKIFFILYIAYFFAKRVHKPMIVKSTHIPFFIIVILTSFVLLRQPDFGLAVTLSATALLLFFIAGLPLKHLFITGCSIVPILAFLILKKSYRLKRILVFLDPWKDPQGSGFQIIQSLIAVGSGSWFGCGISHSKQKLFYLPMQHTDFIFSIIAEETGFIGASCIVFLYMLFLYYGIKIARDLTNPFYYFTTLGFTLLISLQAFINIFVTIGLLPTKGIGLPFISYGNSSLVGTIVMIGIIARIATYEYKRSL